MHEGYATRALIGQNLPVSTVQVYTDWITVYTHRSTTDPSIVCAPQVCVGSAQSYSSVQLCRQKYRTSGHVVYSSTVFMCMNLYI